MTMGSTTARFLGIPDRVVQRHKRGREEHNNAVAFFRWVQMSEQAHPELRNLFAIPNGEHRTAVTGAKLKAQGVRAGVWDYLLAYPKRAGDVYYPGLWIELKSSGGALSEGQEVWQAQMQAAGYAARVCRGWLEARAAVEWYLGLDK